MPAYLPDNPTVRGDLLDYAVEVEYLDSHVGRALKKLEELGELDNTLVVMTSDHGMPFPRVKGQIYEPGYHIPLAIRWGKNIAGGRVVDDFINTRDFAPTFLQAADVQIAGSMDREKFPRRTSVGEGGLRGRITERDVYCKGASRYWTPEYWGYPVRAIRTREFLYVRNYEPDRWPAGNPETGLHQCR